MTEMPRFGLKDFLLLLLVLAAAAGARVGYLWASLDSLADPRWYGELRREHLVGPIESLQVVVDRGLARGQRGEVEQQHDPGRDDYRGPWTTQQPPS